MAFSQKKVEHTHLKAASVKELQQEQEMEQQLQQDMDTTSIKAESAAPHPMLM